MKKNLGRKKSRSYAMKGGAGPYVYEGVALTLGNPYTHIAVNYNDDGTYNFNILEKNITFTKFCELYHYYKENSAISCVHQNFIGPEMLNRAPSFVDILGLALMLTKFTDDNILYIPDPVLKLFFVGLLLEASKHESICINEMGQLLVNPSFKQQMLKVIQLKFYKSFELEKVNLLPIGSLEKHQIDNILLFFKKALFFYRYGVINANTMKSLTFASMLSSTDDAAERALGLDDAAILQFRANKLKDSFISNSRLYRRDKLELALVEEPERARAIAERKTAKSDVSEGSKEFEILQSKLSEIAARMQAFGAKPSDDGLLIETPDTPEKINLQKEYNRLRTEAIKNSPPPPPPLPSSHFMKGKITVRQPLGGRGKTRVKRTNKNRRMRTRRSRTRRTRRRY